jgi:hypothetical protein
MDKQDGLQHNTEELIGSQAFRRLRIVVVGELLDFYQTLVNHHRRAPGDDVMSEVVTAEVLKPDGTRRLLDDL